MRAQEFMRHLRDLLAQVEFDEQPSEQQPGTLAVVKVDNTDGANDASNDGVDTNVMVSPLQQNLELLKKSVGIDSMYDNGHVLQQPDELVRIKKSAGLSPTGIDAIEPGTEL